MTALVTVDQLAAQPARETVHRHDHEHMPDGRLVENSAEPSDLGQDANPMRQAKNGVEINV